MDLISIAQNIWHHKRVTIPALLLTFLGVFYILEIAPPTYKVTSSVLLTNPPGKATKSQIASDPALKNVNPFNTFVSYGSLQVVANTVIDLISSPNSQPALIAAGVIPNYKLALSTDYGNPPIIEITGVGPTPEAAVKSATVLTTAIKQDLYSIQKQRGINPFYMISADTVVKPKTAQTSSSSKLRSLVAILAAGIILLFIVVSFADAVEKRRTPLRRLTTDFAVRGRKGGRVEQRGAEEEPTSRREPMSRYPDDLRDERFEHERDYPPPSRYPMVLCSKITDL